MYSFEHIPNIRGLHSRLSYTTIAPLDRHSIVRLIDELPNDWELCVTIPDYDKKEDRYLFIQRRARSFFRMSGGHGHTSGWCESSLDCIVSEMLDTAIATKAFSPVEVFRVSEKPIH